MRHLTVSSDEHHHDGPAKPAKPFCSRVSTSRDGDKSPSDMPHAVDGILFLRVEDPESARAMTWAIDQYRRSYWQHIFPRSHSAGVDKCYSLVLVGEYDMIVGQREVPR